MHAYACACMHTCVCIHEWVFISMYMSVHAHMCMCMHMCVYVHFAIPSPILKLASLALHPHIEKLPTPKLHVVMTSESLHLMPFCLVKLEPATPRSRVNTNNNASLFHALILTGSLGRCLNTQSIGFVFK